MLSVNLKVALVVLLMQKSCCPFDYALAKRLLIESTRAFSQQKAECGGFPGTALFIDEAEGTSC